MGNASSTSSINFTLINQGINRYLPIPLLFFGTIGNILNIFVFTRETFRNNACVAYFLASTIFDSFVILVGLFPRLLNGFGVDPTQYSAILCKLRFFITYYAGYTAAWFISLACVERYLCSSENVHRRQLITMKRAYLSMGFIILIGCIIFCEEFYCIDINQQLLGAPQSCYQLQSDINCRIFDSLLQFLFQILAPAVMMIVFGLLTIRNVRQKHRRTHPTQMAIATTLTASTNATDQNLQYNSTSLNKQPALTMANRAIQKRDIQLITMLLVQVAVYVIFSFPISIYKLYSVATIYETKSILRKSIENTIFNLSVVCLFVNNCVTFYIYTLCGSTFRKELIKLVRRN